MEYHKTSRLVPRLRFPEFRFEAGWEVKTLSSVCEINPPQSELPASFAYINLNSVKSGEHLKQKLTSQSESPRRSSRLSYNNDIIFKFEIPSQHKNLFLEIENGRNNVGSKDHIQLRAIESPIFIYHLLHINSFVDSVLRRSQGLTYPVVKESDLSSIPVTIPSLPEQQKIVDCLGSLVNLIATCEQKLKILKRLKLGLMQQLFPQTGESNPRLRFPEFRDKPGWGREKLGNICEVIIGGKPKTTIPEYWGGDINWLTPNDMTQMSSRNISSTSRQITKTGLENSTTKMVPENSIIMSTQSQIGHLAINTVPMTFNQNCHGLVPNNQVNYLFIYFFLLMNKHILRQFCEGGPFPWLETETIKNLSIALPSLIEQKKVAASLSSVDNLIMLNVQKLLALGHHKQGLMQQLLPNVEIS